MLVVEPTRKSVSVYHQYRAYAAEQDVAISVVGNKVMDAGDVEFLREHVGGDLLGWIGWSAAVRAAERGEPLRLADLAESDRAALAAIRATLDTTGRDWPRYTRQAVEFHLRNAAAWGDRATGERLADQVDPDFVLGPDSLTQSAQSAQVGGAAAASR